MLRSREEESVGIRLVRLEEKVEHIHSDVAELKADMRGVKADISALKVGVEALRSSIESVKVIVEKSKVWMLVTALSVGGTVLAVMAHGFKWL
jgi:hypothetical protein